MKYYFVSLYSCILFYKSWNNISSVQHKMKQNVYLFQLWNGNFIFSAWGTSCWGSATIWMVTYIYTTVMLITLVKFLVLSNLQSDIPSLNNICFIHLKTNPFWNVYILLIPLQFLLFFNHYFFFSVPQKYTFINSVNLKFARPRNKGFENGSSVS